MTKLDENKIIDIIRKNPFISFVDIARKLKIKSEKNHELTQTLIKLNNEFLISSDRRKSTYYALEFIETVQGKLKFAGEGKFAFIDTENIDEEGQTISYFVPAIFFKDAMNGDTVQANVYKR
ncbi:UNVERIFIED_CONTAM: hypothetical protein O8I53_05585 [Campylobacter lari]